MLCAMHAVKEIEVIESASQNSETARGRQKSKWWHDDNDTMIQQEQSIMETLKGASQYKRVSEGF